MLNLTKIYSLIVNMRAFQFLVATSAVTTYPAFLAQKTEVKSKNNGHGVPISCDSNRACPAGSACYKLVGDYGLCVLTLPK